jgi:hypothetical protein
MSNGIGNVSAMPQPKPLLMSSQPQQAQHHQGSRDKRTLAYSPTSELSFESPPNSAQDTFSSATGLSPPGSPTSFYSDRAEPQFLQMNSPILASFGASPAKSPNTQQRPIDRVILLQKANGNLLSLNPNSSLIQCLKFFSNTTYVFALFREFPID